MSEDDCKVEKFHVYKAVLTQFLHMISRYIINIPTIVREVSLFTGWGGRTSRKSLYLSRMTLFKQTILYVSLYFP